jgi:geranylgeranyl diphosphate synthase, type II
MPSALEKRLLDERRAVDESLVRLMPPEELYPPRIHRAMSDAVLAGGKRLRPILLLEAASVVGERDPALRKAAAAIELVHTASLILDDLPSMDDAELRRGKPTVHKVYGEATAILAAISLLSYSFELLAESAAELRVRKAQATEAISELGRAIGSKGLSAGQQVDLEPETYGPSFESLEFVHSRKTGALFIAAARIGAILARASALQLDALSSYAKNLGLAFQITDDILDAEGDVATLGKDVHKDAGKTTFVSLFGAEASRRAILGLVDTAKRSLSLFGAEAELLRGLADYVAVRKT